MQLETNRHLHEDEIEKYSMGAVSHEEASCFEEHLLICESCQERVTETDRYVSSMRSASARIREVDRRASNKRRWFSRPVPALATAASVLLLGAVGLEWANGPSGWRSRVDAEPAIAVNLVATRGNGIEAKAPARRALNLRLDLAGLPPEASFRLEIVDASGKPVWQGAAVPQDSKATASVSRLSTGLYFLRAYAPSGELLREFGLDVE